jgi:hypothetical protein
MARLIQVLCFILVLLVGMLNSLTCLAQVSLPANVRIKSVRQKILSAREFVFFDQVDFLLEGRLHVFSDRLFLDADKQCARAEAYDEGFIVLQDEHMLLLANRCFIDIVSGEVTLANGRIEGVEGFLAAKELYRDEAGAWLGHDVVYTPCDADTPHWQMQAKSLSYNTSYLKLENIKFLINKMTVAWLPGIVVPLPRKSNSGFLVPRFMLDYKYGLGLRQDYYWYINEHADITTGIDWKNGRGVFGAGEVRWATNNHHTGYFKGYGGYAEQIYVQRRDSIVQAGKPQYWLEGKHTYGTAHFMGAEYFSALTLLDYGTDKKTGYEFFDNLESVDDTFYNGLLLRGYSSAGLVQAVVDSAQTSRKNFSIAPVNKLFTELEQAQFILHAPVDRAVQEFDNRSSVLHRPQILWTGLLGRHGLFSYKNFYMVDYALMREQENERVFLLSKLAKEERIIPRAEAESLRFEYGGAFALHVPTSRGTFYTTCSPLLSVRSQVSELTKQLSFGVEEHSLFAHGAYRTLIKGTAGYVFPVIEFLDCTDDTIFSLQPRFYGEAAPFLEQQAWPVFDRFDRHYPTQQFGFFCDYSLKLGGQQLLRGYVKQGYDIVPQPLWFAPKRTGAIFHNTPLSYGITSEGKAVSCSIEQEFCSNQQKLLTSFVHTKAMLGSNEFHLGYLFQDISVSRARRQQAQSAHAFFISTAVSLTPQARFKYSGFFVAEQNVVGSGGFMLVPIKHEARFEYRGHCWGCYVGVEEKFYRQYSNNKHDRAFVLSVYIDSLGSFAKKIKNNSDLISSAVSR